MQWTFRDDVPIYLQLIDQMRLKIISGDYPPGYRLPGVRELAAEAGINPNTVQRAMAELERMGLVYSQRTAGRSVTEDTAVIQSARRDIAAAHVRDFMKTMKELGFTPEETVEMLSGKDENNVCT